MARVRTSYRRRPLAHLDDAQTSKDRARSSSCPIPARQLLLAWNSMGSNRPTEVRAATPLVDRTQHRRHLWLPAVRSSAVSAHQAPVADALCRFLPPATLP